MNTPVDLQAEILKAISHPNRIRILNQIRKGMNCNCEIAPALDLEQSNLSRHLKILVKSGILRSSKDGLRTNYEISDHRIYDLIKIASEISKSNLEKKLNVFKIG